MKQWAVTLAVTRALIEYAAISPLLIDAQPGGKTVDGCTSSGGLGVPEVPSQHGDQ